MNIIKIFNLWKKTFDRYPNRITVFEIEWESWWISITILNLEFVLRIGAGKI